jgi:hypothetical protein
MNDAEDRKRDVKESFVCDQLHRLAYINHKKRVQAGNYGIISWEMVRKFTSIYKYLKSSFC